MRFKNILLSTRSALKNQKKEKRKFLVAGILNVLITKLFLQFFLAANLFNVTISTFLSQLINMTFGYALYGKFIFQVNNVKNVNFIRKYFLLMISIWIFNAIGINCGSLFNFSNNISAILMMPFLALLSYLGQKLWVFKQN